MMVESMAVANKRPKIRIKGPSMPLHVLPDELLSEILRWLPVRSLLQFKCVSKQWKTLISEPHFAKDHLSTSIAHSNMANQRVVYSRFGRLEIESYSVQSLFQNPSFPDESHCFMMDQDYIILGSCNGLLCLCDALESYFMLWNPSIRVISKSFLTDAGESGQFITNHGFGYDHVNDKYKLLIAVHDYNHSETVTKIHTFGGANSKSSKVIQNFSCPADMGNLGLFVSGTLNWIAKRGHQWVVLSLDLTTETCGEEVMLLPDGDSDSVCIPQLSVVRNCPCVTFFDSKKNHWVVSLMMEYGVQQSWTKLMTIPGFVHVDRPWRKLKIPHNKLCTSRSKWCYSALDRSCILEKGLLLIIPVSEIVVYNSNDGRLGYLSIGGCNVQTYHQSLVSLPC